jgi:hypothetical protein
MERDDATGFDDPLFLGGTDWPAPDRDTLPPPPETLRDRVLACLLAAAIPVADPTRFISGFEVADDGRLVSLTLFASDGGIDRTARLWRAYLVVAHEILLENGLAVTIAKPDRELAVALPEVA